MTSYTLGDFGAGGPRSQAGDELIDMKERAIEVADGRWEYQAHTSNTVGWHIPETPKELLLKRSTAGWQLKRATQIVGSRETLAEGPGLAGKYMENRPAGRQ